MNKLYEISSFNDTRENSYVLVSKYPFMCVFPNFNELLLICDNNKTKITSINYNVIKNYLNIDYNHITVSFKEKKNAHCVIDITEVNTNLIKALVYYE